VLSLAWNAHAQSTAGFPPAPGGAAPPSAPPPGYGPPPPRAPAPPPAPYPPQGYVPPPAPYPPQGYVPPAPAPAPYPPQGYAPPAPYAPPGYPPGGYPPPGYAPPGYPPAPRPPAYAPGYGPPQPGAVPPAYAPYAPPAPPPPRDPLLDDDFRYRQQLGAYRRGDARAPYPGAAGPSGPGRTAYVRVADRSRRRHDGLYFRFAGGMGSAHDSMHSSGPLPTPFQFPFELTPLEGSGSAFSGVTELAFGLTPGPGVVLGVGAYTATIPRLKADVTDTNTGSYRFRLSQLAVIGPFMDWYVSPEGGLHFQGSPGVATYVAGAGDAQRQGPLAQAHTAVGFGFMLGVGYEWWIGDQWSLGLLGRFMYGATSGSDASGNGLEWSHKTYVPALLISTTYH
jgi:hypothetical protein